MSLEIPTFLNDQRQLCDLRSLMSETVHVEFVTNRIIEEKFNLILL